MEERVSGDGGRVQGRRRLWKRKEMEKQRIRNGQMWVIRAALELQSAINL